MTTLRARTALVVFVVFTATSACGGGDGGASTAAPSTGASTSSAPSPSPAPSPVTAASGQAAAEKINLRAADLPGYTATPATKEDKADAQEKASQACIGASTGEPVAEFSSDDFEKGAALPSVQFASKVSFRDDAATVRSDLAAFSSEKASGCLSTFAAQIFAGVNPTSGITFAAPEVTKMTPAAAGVDGAFGYSIKTIATAKGQKVPFVIEFLGASKGRTKLTLSVFAVGGPVPAAERDILFATLMQRTSANAL